VSGYGLETLGIVCALGSDVASVATRLFSGEADRLTDHLLRSTRVTVPTGRVQEPLPTLPDDLARYDCRNHRLAYAAFLQIEEAVAALVDRFGADRIGVVLGSSTAGLDATEHAYEIWKKEGALPPRYDYKRQHAMGSVAAVIAAAAGARGPGYTLSTACTSSAKAMISARDLLATGFVDAVITGGVDTLCDLTLNGFEALAALSRERCQPMSRNRTGLNIGEGAALFVMTRASGPVDLIGGGESGDAHHMTAPHPEGAGAERAMRAALRDANLAPGDIAYLNLHGTATPQNDAMEALAVARVFDGVRAGSTKPLVGHCLGAAGAIEAAFCWLALHETDGSVRLPPHVFDGEIDPEIPVPRLTRAGETLTGPGPFRMMSNSFAFGGNNCALILEGGNR